MFLTNANFSRRLLRWYDGHRRELPWRAAPGRLPDPYHVLVSECMLQQTQVATVLPYFQRFISHLPTLRALAQADEQEILRLWQGLGYYSRARNLRSAARHICHHHGGRIPKDVQSLLNLPGIGRYTAGAIASIAYDIKAPILDGNVARVLCRLDRIDSDPRERKTHQWLWRRAEEILPSKRVGDFNSALMELGATVCTPRSPDCGHCPVQKHCQAFAGGVAVLIPPSRKSRLLPLLRRRTFCICRRHRGQTRWLIEQRPRRGRWAGLWQFVTVESDAAAMESTISKLPVSLKTAPSRQIGTICHSLTHRRYEFDVYLCDLGDDGGPKTIGPSRRWVRLEEIHAYPLPRPQLRIVEILRAQDPLKAQ